MFKPTTPMEIMGITMAEATNIANSRICLELTDIQRKQLISHVYNLAMCTALVTMEAMGKGMGMRLPRC